MSAHESGRTTCMLRDAVDHMLRTRCDVMILVDHRREVDHMLRLLVDVLGITPDFVSMSHQMLMIEGQRMVFVDSLHPELARGFDRANIFIDHHFNEVRRWQDWHWLFVQ